MLSIGRCRQLIANSHQLTDEEIERLRDDVRIVAQAAIAAALKAKREPLTGQPISCELKDKSLPAARTCPARRQR